MNQLQTCQLYLFKDFHPPPDGARATRTLRLVTTMHAGYAGTFTCDGPCGRQRLTAAEFSKRQITLHRTDRKPLKCKQCVADAAKLERDAAELRAKTRDLAIAGGEGETGATCGSGAGESGDGGKVEELTCIGCRKSLPTSSFTSTQIGKARKGKRGSPKCRACVEEGAAAEAKANEERAKKKLESARAASDAAFSLRGRRRTGGRGASAASVAARLAAATQETALEAEAVTGLRAVKGGSRAGRGRWSARGRGRGRSRR